MILIHINDEKFLVFSFKIHKKYLINNKIQFYIDNLRLTFNNLIKSILIIITNYI